ncbi:GOLPH3/VPS74 family protein [Streptomyces angustmyceticus]|uniref:GOLPH3/VPS74 family protein n=1 Tax=Streptomyces angustmyceticus TaxID=285578 RepID=UPI003D8AFE48
MPPTNGPARSLADEVMLHAAAATGGRTAVWRIELSHALAGAVLIDLSLAGRIALRSDRVTVVRPGPVGDPVQDEALRRLAHGRRTASPETWVGRLAPHVLVGVQERLVDRGLLVPDSGHGVLSRSPLLRPKGSPRPSPHTSTATALRALLQAAFPRWISGFPQPPDPAQDRTYPPPDTRTDTVAVASSAVAASVRAAAHALMCGY